MSTLFERANLIRSLSTEVNLWTSYPKGVLTLSNRAAKLAAALAMVSFEEFSARSLRSCIILYKVIFFFLLTGSLVSCPGRALATLFTVGYRA